MVVTQNEELHKYMASMKSQGMSSTRYYWHDIIGYNYRMTNIQAAIGLAQIEQIHDILSRKRGIAEFYRREILSRDLPLQMLWEQKGCTNGFWLPSILFDKSICRDEIIIRLKEKYNIETRPAFYPVHDMPIYATCKLGSYPVAERLSSGGMNLPGYPSLDVVSLQYIVDALENEVK